MENNSIQIPWKLVGWTVGAWWIAHAALILGHVLLVFLYSLAVAPGLPPAEYVAFAQRSGPWYSILLGGPVFYAIGRFLHRRVAPHGRPVCLVIWTLYSLTDLAIVLASLESMPLLFQGQWVASQSVKLAAVWLATRSEGRAASRSPAD